MPQQQRHASGRLSWQPLSDFSLRLELRPRRAPDRARRFRPAKRAAAYLLTGLGEAQRAFHDDLKRIGRTHDMAIMMFSEFGRRVDTARLSMFVIGKTVEPGLYGKHPSLKDLDANGDLKMATDFRRVYVTMIKEWDIRIRNRF
jgi:hypothetical protein